MYAADEKTVDPLCGAKPPDQSPCLRASRGLRDAIGRCRELVVKNTDAPETSINRASRLKAAGGWGIMFPKYEPEGLHRRDDGVRQEADA